MNYLNLHTDTLRSVEYLGAEPTVRATWLNLLGWCASQENGGRIVGAKDWPDRKWQQLCGVTRDEALTESELFWSDGRDVVVNFYPKDKEEAVKTNRENGRAGGTAKSDKKSRAAKENGAKGGRPSNNPSENPSENPTERKGKEGNGKECVCVESQHTHTHMDSDWISKLNTCHPSYSSPELSAKERPLFDANLPYIRTIPDSDWPIIARFMSARHNQGSGTWKPKNRMQLIDNIDQVHTYAVDWDRKNPPHKPKPASIDEFPNEPPASPDEVRKVFAEIFPNLTKGKSA